MCTPIGHGLAGVTVLVAARALSPSRIPVDVVWIAAFFTAGSLPDLDAPFAAAFGPILMNLPFPPSVAAPHRGISHTLAYVCLAGPLWAWCVSRFRPVASFSRIAVLAAVAAGTHLVLDILTGCGKSIPALWPITAEGFQATRHWLPCARFSSTWTGLFTLWFSRFSLDVILVEVAVFTPLLASATYWNLRTRLPAPWARVPAGIALTAAAWAGSVAIAVTHAGPR